MRPDKITVHCSASNWGDDQIIKQWHTDPKYHNNGKVTYQGRKYQSKDELPVFFRRNPHRRGNGWLDTGYHAIICNGYPDYTSWARRKPKKSYDGLIQPGRSETQTGAHVGGHNRNNLGICCIGIDKFTENQFNSLTIWLLDRMEKYSIPHSMVLGHNEYPGHESRGCPNIDMQDLRLKLRSGIIKPVSPGLTW